MKIGLLGGSFNPVHLGHLALAKAALEQADLDNIWFLPSGNHPLKNNSDLLEFEKRLELLQKVISEIPEYEISNYDADTQKPSYTSELIKKLTKLYSGYQFYFICGYDIIAELPRWHQSQWLIDNVNFIIINRPQYDAAGNFTALKLKHSQEIKIPPIPISSTQIRRNVKKGKSIVGMVPPKIISQIKKYYK